MVMPMPMHIAEPVPRVASDAVEWVEIAIAGLPIERVWELLRVQERCGDETTATIDPWPLAINATCQTTRRGEAPLGINQAHRRIIAACSQRFGEELRSTSSGPARLDS